MAEVFTYAAIAACVVTAGILLLGIRGFGSSTATPRSQNRLMRMRIIAQFVAVVLIMITVYLLKGD